MCRQEGSSKVQQSRLQAPAREENVNASVNRVHDSDERGHEAKFTRERSWKRFTPVSASSSQYCLHFLLEAASELCLAPAYFMP